MDNAQALLTVLNKEYPAAATALSFENPLDILVATILSAQCTDARVNIVTKALFTKYKTVSDYASARKGVFERAIHSTGFYRSKAKNIIAAAKMIIEKFKGKVPDTMEELIQLPGVARKTANIVLVNGFGKVEGIAVDTHVRRLSQRLGLSKHDDPEKIEQDLMRLFDRRHWGRISNLLIEHGRAVCAARKPLCLKCVLADKCPSKRKFYP
jgi:endonuclease-3